MNGQDADQQPGAEPVARDAQLAQMQQQTAQAMAVARRAVNDTGRVIRLLTVVTEPLPPDVLIERAMDVLSEVFIADVACVADVAGSGLVVAQSCGLAEDDASRGSGWPLGDLAIQALRVGRPVTASGEMIDGQVPPSLAAIGVRHVAWVPLSVGPDVSDKLVILCRTTSAPFTPADLYLLGSATARLGLAIDARERSAGHARLAGSGHRLAKHLDLPPMLDEAAVLLRELVDADATFVGVVNGETIGLAATCGEVPVPVPVPGPADLLPGFESVRLGRAVRQRDGGSDRGGRPGAPSRPVAVLGVPVQHDDTLIAVLYAWRGELRPFTAYAEATAQVFATHLAASTANARLYRALGRSEASLRLITESISDMVAVVGRDGVYRYVSPSHLPQLGHQPIPGQCIHALAHPDDRPMLSRALREAGRSHTVEHRYSDARGNWVWVETALRATTPAGDGDDCEIVLSSRVIEDRKRLEAELRHRAMHDPLTGLANRSMLTERLGRALTGRPDRRIGLLFCDIDEFKAVNDRLGHEAGDELLVQIAARLRHCLRPADTLVRFGGDEFVFVLDDMTSLDDVHAVGKRVLHSLDQPFVLRGQQVPVTTSIGGVLGVPGRCSANDLLRDADSAMYVAKERGRARIEVFDEVQSHQRVDRLDIRSDVPGALDRNELSVHYQPIFTLPDGHITGFEALLRWTHPDRGPVPPDVFIPMAEECGAIVPMGRWVLQQATAQLAAWHRLLPGRRLTVNVNLSATQLQQPDLATEILGIICDSAVEPDHVCLEVTEHGHIRHDVTEFARELQAHGVRFALDDFGISYSNLSHLRKFPVTCLKIDRSFVAEMTADRADNGLVRAVLALAGALDLDVVAEGIETAEQLRLLTELGCRYGQGYLRSRPLPADEATTLLRETSPWQ